jgi:hypothetical protein
MVTFTKLGDPLYGRLGNQLFQVAATIAIAQKNGHQFTFPEWHYSTYFKNKLPTETVHNFRVYKQRSLNYYDVKLSKGVNWDLQGFFQSEKFFKNAEQTVKHFLEPTETISAYIKNKYADLLSGKTCSLHIRRGDYLAFNLYFPSQPIQYYKKAIERIGKERTFLIFSDDIAWCKQQFEGNNYHFIENEIDIVDMLLMSYCDDHIISNSSFSWWGAWLNASSEKTIICPERWFGPATAFNSNNYSKDIFSTSFEKIVIPAKGIKKYADFYNPFIYLYCKVLNGAKVILRPIVKPLFNKFRA